MEAIEAGEFNLTPNMKDKWDMIVEYDRDIDIIKRKLEQEEGAKKPSEGKQEQDEEAERQKLNELVQEFVDTYNLKAIKKANITRDNAVSYYEQYESKLDEIRALAEKLEDPIDYVKGLSVDLKREFADVTDNISRRIKSQVKAKAPAKPKAPSEGKQEKIRNPQALNKFYDEYKGVKSTRALNSLKKNLKEVTKDESMYDDVLDELMEVRMKNFYPTPAECLDKPLIKNIIERSEHVLEPTAGRFYDK